MRENEEREPASKFLKDLGCVWSEETGSWMYGHGMGWTSQIEPELAKKLYDLLASTAKATEEAIIEARIDEAEHFTTLDGLFYHVNLLPNGDKEFILLHERIADLRKALSIDQEGK